MKEILTTISIWSVPLIVLMIPVYGYFKGVNIYDAFTDGAKDGFSTIFKIFPNLLAMMLAIFIFRNSGAMDIVIRFLRPLLDYLKIPEPVFPLIFLRPLSGSGSLSYVNTIMTQYGPDSFIGKLASTIQGSTETTFYIIAVYFGSIGIKKYRYSMIVGLIADITGFFASVFICKILFF